METEIWKDITGFEGLYQVSSLGRVKSFKWGKERILNYGANSCGYLMICLHKDKKNFIKYIHRIVWDAFGSSPRNGRILQIDHIDNNKLNNRIENLQLLSSRENNSKKIYENKSSKYKGVTWFKRDLKWRAQIKINGKLKHLGYFTSEKKAAEAYQQALNELNNC